MLRETQQSEAMLKEVNDLFGKDKHCSKWKPVNRMGNDILIHYSYDPDDEPTDLPKKVKFIVHYYLFAYLITDLLRSNSACIPIPEALFYPGNPALSDLDG